MWKQFLQRKNAELLWNICIYENIIYNRGFWISFAFWRARAKLFRFIFIKTNKNAIWARWVNYTNGFTSSRGISFCIFFFSFTYHKAHGKTQFGKLRLKWISMYATMHQHGFYGCEHRKFYSVLLFMRLILFFLRVECAIAWMRMKCHPMTDWARFRIRCSNESVM